MTTYYALYSRKNLFCLRIMNLLHYDFPVTIKFYETLVATQKKYFQTSFVSEQSEKPQHLLFIAGKQFQHIKRACVSL